MSDIILCIELAIVSVVAARMIWYTARLAKVIFNELAVVIIMSAVAALVLSVVVRFNPVPEYAHAFLHTHRPLIGIGVNGFLSVVSGSIGNAIAAGKSLFSVMLQMNA